MSFQTKALCWATIGLEGARRHTLGLTDQINSSHALKVATSYSHVVRMVCMITTPTALALLLAEARFPRAIPCRQDTLALGMLRCLASYTHASVGARIISSCMALNVYTDACLLNVSDIGAFLSIAVRSLRN
eukprot:3219416-Pleurochrysis_carterae.AAC.1